jgi:hypothetical protein
VHLYASDVKRKLPDGGCTLFLAHRLEPTFLHLHAAAMMLKTSNDRL